MRVRHLSLALWCAGTALQPLVAQNPALVRQLPKSPYSSSPVPFSPDGRWIATGGATTASLFDAQTGSLLRTFLGHTRLVTTVAFSTDGSLLASGSSDNTVKLWGTATGAELRTLIGHSAEVQSLAFSPDGRLLASGGFDGSLLVWDYVQGTRVATLVGHARAVRSLAFSADSRTLASASGDGMLMVWEMPSGRLLNRLPGAGFGGRLAVSADGRWLVHATSDPVIRVYDLTTFAVARTLQGLEGGAYGLALGPDGATLAVGGARGVVALYDFGTGVQLSRFDGHPGSAVPDLAFSPDGRFLTTSASDSVVRLWSVPGLRGGTGMAAAPVDGKSVPAMAPLVLPQAASPSASSGGLYLEVLGLSVQPPTGSTVWRAGVSTPSGGNRMDQLLATGPNGEQLAVNVVWNATRTCANVIATLLMTPGARMASTQTYRPTGGWFSIGVEKESNSGFLCLPLASGSLVVGAVAPDIATRGIALVRPAIFALGQAAFRRYGRPAAGSN